MKLAICLPCVLGVLLAFNTFAQQDQVNPSSTSASPVAGTASSAPSGSSGEKDKDKAKARAAKEGKERKEGKEGKDGDKDKDKEKGSSQDGVKLEAPKGDTLKLKNGKVLEGVKIIRTTPREYQVEVTHGGVPITIPHNQVESVTYDRSSGASGDAASETGASIIPGQKLSPELDKKLSSTDIAHPPLEYKDADLLKILDDLSKKAGVKITADQSVKDLAPKDRTWSFTTKEGATLQTLLATDLPAQFPKLAVQYQFDAIMVITKDAAAKLNATPPAAGDAKASPDTSSAGPAKATDAKTAPAAPSTGPAKAPEAKK